ncbi:alpha/beta fold hydrolase [Mycobacterium talmoniae]|uniref:3-oxoadipate enol-lactonase 2 n=1 Tax=Mycobacterium talmoniae TaxID=1858794 RepID=A0A1S1MY91_9MYCO|nr:MULTISPECIES: alpha/beta hydrolase [Mycobacterium]OHU92356.1 alpha/beta hydrolase [Mycobacterium talmoniae]PQM46608.1 3-oxoadipate enol-lactonase 2 [Mycobacterium talmoniae]TDH48078.1 alpha/beta hydrolase [Mycobacterium eburneum]
MADRGRWRSRWLAGAAGVTAVGSIAGVTVARSMTRRTTLDDPYLDEDFDVLNGDRSTVVTTSDGVSLAVREVGPPDAPLTVVFAHGFCLRMGAFHFQRMRLTQEWGPQVRMVFYDQRGHGLSGEAAPDTYTVPQLGEDLEAVLRATAPRGPVVLVGHSMGGMTVLSHARQFPQHYGSRIVGAALIASAAKGVSRSPLGEILRNPALEAVQFSARYAPKLVHRGRGAARAVIGPILRAASYGNEKISPSVVAFSEKMMHDTPIATLVGFLHALEVHDESAALPILSRIPTLIACGDHDLLTPDGYSRAMAAALWDCELVVVGGAGHLVQLEEPDAINDGLVRLVERATPTRLAALTRRLRDRTRHRA